MPRRVLRLREYVVVEADRLDAVRHYDLVSQLSYRPHNGLPWDIVGWRTVTSILECSHCSAVSSVIIIITIVYFKKVFIILFIFILSGSILHLFV